MRTPPFPLSPDTELRINGQVVVVRDVSKTGQVRVECPLRKTSTSFGVLELVAMRLRGEVEHVGAKVVAHVPSGQATLRPLKDEQRLRAARRIAYVRIAAQLFPVGPKSERLKLAVSEVAVRIKDAKPPSCHSVYRWTRRYVTSGFNTAVFVQDAGAIRTRAPRIEPRARELLRQRIEILLGENVGATLNGVMNKALAQVAIELGYPTFTTTQGDTMFPSEFLGQLPKKTPNATKARANEATA